MSDAATPTQQRLHRASDGVEVRVLDEGKIPTLAEYQGRLSKPEFVQVKARRLRHGSDADQAA